MQQSCSMSVKIAYPDTIGNGKRAPRLRYAQARGRWTLPCFRLLLLRAVIHEEHLCFELADSDRPIFIKAEIKLKA